MVAMNIPDKLTKEGAAWLAGKGAHNCYLEKIRWNMRTMMGQIDAMETIFMEVKDDIDLHLVRQGVAQK